MVAYLLIIPRQCLVDCHVTLTISQADAGYLCWLFSTSAEEDKTRGALGRARAQMSQTPFSLHHVHGSLVNVRARWGMTRGSNRGTAWLTAPPPRSQNRSPFIHHAGRSIVCDSIRP